MRMAEVVNKTEGLLCKIHSEALDILHQDQESAERDTVVEDKKFITTLNRAIDSCIRWQES